MTDRTDIALPQTGTGADRRWIAGILVLAVVLRVPGLNAPLWYDEIDTLVQYARLPLAELVLTYPSLNNHMLYSILASLSIGAFGESAWALRLPALLFGLGSIWTVWLLGRQIVTAPAANLAALLMTVSYHHVWFSQNARGYTGLLFFGTLATYLLIRGLREPRWSFWLAYGGCLAAAMYIHLSAAFFFAAHGLAYLLVLAAQTLRGRREIPFVMPMAGAFFGIAITLALYAPLIPQIAATVTKVSIGNARASFAASMEIFENPIWTLLEMLDSLSGLGPLLFVAVAALATALTAATVQLFLRGQRLFALILPIQIAVTLGVLVALAFRVWPRYFFVDLGLICLLLVQGAYVLAGLFNPVLVRIFRRPVRPATSGFALAALGVVVSLALLPKNYLAPKQDFPGARDFVEARRSDTSTVITLGLTRMPYEVYYAPDWDTAESLGEFQALYQPGRETWVVYTFPSILERRHADIFAAMEGKFEKAKYFPGTLGNGGMIVLKAEGGE